MQIKKIKRMTILLPILLMVIVFLSTSVQQTRAYSTSFNKEYGPRNIGFGNFGMKWGQGDSRITGTIVHGKNAYVQINTLKMHYIVWNFNIIPWKNLHSVRVTLGIEIGSLYVERDDYIAGPYLNIQPCWLEEDEYSYNPNFRVYASSSGYARFWIRCYVEYWEGFPSQPLELKTLGYHGAIWFNVGLGNVYYSSSGGGGGPR